VNSRGPTGGSFANVTTIVCGSVIVIEPPVVGAPGLAEKKISDAGGGGSKSWMGASYFPIITLSVLGSTGLLNETVRGFVASGKTPSVAPTREGSGGGR
jgi:hypothetical protein